uniref:hypothetical protein n=1 Tax=Burkholderia pseudomallei TaxID=28450 RepID=UPI0011C3C235|nr:hypothetical protein [Burkholderia pseudomallei]
MSQSKCSSARLHLRRHAGNQMATRPARDRLAESVGDLVSAELPSDVAGHDVLQDLRDEERHQRRDGRQEPRIAIRPHDDHHAFRQAHRSDRFLEQLVRPIVSVQQSRRDVRPNRIGDNDVSAR